MNDVKWLLNEAMNAMEHIVHVCEIKASVEFSNELFGTQFAIFRIFKIYSRYKVFGIINVPGST